MCHIYQHNHTHFVATYVLPTPSSPITSVHEYIQHQRHMHILLKPNFTWRKACKFSTLAQLLKIAIKLKKICDILHLCIIYSVYYRANDTVHILPISLTLGIKHFKIVNVCVDCFQPKVCRRKSFWIKSACEDAQSL